MMGILAGPKVLVLLWRPIFGAAGPHLYFPQDGIDGLNCLRGLLGEDDAKIC
jgi:hypothetical protein